MKVGAESKSEGKAKAEEQKQQRQMRKRQWKPVWEWQWKRKRQRNCKWGLENKRRWKRRWKRRRRINLSAMAEDYSLGLKKTITVAGKEEAKEKTLMASWIFGNYAKARATMSELHL